MKIANLKVIAIVISLLTFAYSVSGQISPGKLSSAHQELEGVSNCTQCHDFGNKVPDSKCLDCHSEVDELINQNRGYHASSEVRSLTCVECHSDHHGRKFEMVRFDEDNFDHSLTGYELIQSHVAVDCRNCHKSDFIKSPDLKNRENTFLGLNTDCLTCHNDFHQGTLSSQCTDCHNIESFRPAQKFKHNETSFPLTGAHEDLNCIECHPIESRNNTDFQQFSGIDHNSCVDCHTDPHNNLPGTCTQCHTTESFTSFQGNTGFNHNQTEFQLRGKHLNVNCFECHSNSVLTENLFRDQTDISVNDCKECHKDVHENKFGSECASCHQETSWNSIRNLDFFDHSLTDYPLEGLHQQIDCNKCHISEKFTDPLEFNACTSCHDDYHEGAFVNQENQIRDCRECHTLQEKFDYTLYGPEEHSNSAFPLEGAHLATPCFACHISEDKWTFADLGSSCIDCHDDIHQEFIDISYYPEQDCRSCHTSEAWNEIEFDHSLTEWTLEGKHKTVSCRECHFAQDNTDIDGNSEQYFSSLSSVCSSCHENVHDKQFEIEGITDCKRCHVSSSWVPENFDHSVTRFDLTGKHKDLECSACHFEEQAAEGQSQVIYKIEKFECIDCHL